VRRVIGLSTDKAVNPIQSLWCIKTGSGEGLLSRQITFRPEDASLAWLDMATWLVAVVLFCLSLSL